MFVRPLDLSLPFSYLSSFEYLCSPCFSLIPPPFPSFCFLLLLCYTLIDIRCCLMFQHIASGRQISDVSSDSLWTSVLAVISMALSFSLVPVGFISHRVDSILKRERRSKGGTEHKMIIFASFVCLFFSLRRCFHCLYCSFILQREDGIGLVCGLHVCFL